MKLNVAVEFSGVAGNIADTRSNNIGLLIISKSGLVTFNGKVRVRYSDL